MGYFTTIHIVTVEKLNQMLEKRMWFWDDTEGRDMYESAVIEVGDSRIVTLYSIDIQENINELVDKLMANRHSSVTPSPLQELRSNRKELEKEEASWTELVFRPDGCFTFERLLSPDYWPYIMEPYSGELARGTQAWRVLDATTATPIAIIRPKEVGTGTAFTVVVNGYSQTQTFGDLKSAAIYAATEYNG